MPFRVLVADDEEIERRALRLILGGAGMPDLEIIEASNGREALDLVGDGKLDAAFLDIRMPGIDGIEAAGLLRQARPRLPIVFLTAYDSFEYARSALRLRVEDFLLKPASPDEVAAALRRVLGEGLPAPAAEKLESAVSYIAGELRADLGKGALIDERVARYLDLSGRPGGVRAVLALKLDEAPANRPARNQERGAATLRSVAGLAERILASGARIAIAGAGTDLALCVLIGEPSAAEAEGEYRIGIERLMERARADLGLALAVGAAISVPGIGSASGSELAQAARRAAALTGAGRPIMLLSLSSSGTELGEKLPEPARAGRGTVSRALELLESRHAEELSLELVAEELEVSPSHLSRLLGRYAGMGFADCLARLRVERAKGYLSSSRATVKEVSLMVGFRDPAYFARVFRRFEGESPAEFRIRGSLGPADRSDPPEEAER